MLIRSLRNISPLLFRQLRLPKLPATPIRQISTEVKQDRESKQLLTPFRGLRTTTAPNGPEQKLAQMLLQLRTNLEMRLIEKNKIARLFEEIEKLKRLAEFDYVETFGIKIKIEPHHHAKLIQFLDFLKEHHLLESLLKCENLSAVIQLSAILFHQGLTDCIKAIIKDETNVPRLLEVIQRDLLIEISMENNQFDHHYRQVAKVHHDYHRLLIANRNIADDLRKIIYHNAWGITDNIDTRISHLTREKLEEIVLNVKAFNAQEILEQIKNHKPSPYFSRLVSRQPALVATAFELSKLIKADDMTNSEIYRYFLEYPQLAPFFLVACKKAMNSENKTALCQSEFMSIANKIRYQYAPSTSIPNKLFQRMSDSNEVLWTRADELVERSLKRMGW